MKKIGLKIGTLIGCICMVIFFSACSEKKVNNNNNLFLGTGWNLGNTLDSIEATTTTNEMIEKAYQGMLSFETNPYSEWVASESKQFQEDQLNIDWEITGISDITSQPYKFNLQIFNNYILDSQGAELIFDVQKAELKLCDGTMISFTDTIKTYTEPYDGIYAGNIEILLEKYDLSCSDLEGAMLSISVQMKEYPKEIKYVSKEEYYEKLFGNEMTSEELFEEIRNAGFKTVRVPVTYVNHVDSEGRIDEEWLKRVETIVNYVLNQDMYCIINVMHDVGNQGLINTDSDRLEESKKVLKSRWEQIAEHFKEYDNYLIFEGFNEILNANGDWICTNADDINNVNELNQLFVDTVRKTGGKNATRTLIVNTYAAGNYESALNGFELPKDKKNNLMVGVHVYEEAKDLPGVFERLKTKFLDNNIPVVISEMGYVREETKQLESTKIFKDLSKEYGCAFLWWDNGSYESDGQVANYALLDRTTFEWYSNELIDVLTNNN